MRLMKDPIWKHEQPQNTMQKSACSNCIMDYELMQKLKLDDRTRSISHICLGHATKMSYRNVRCQKLYPINKMTCLLTLQGSRVSWYSSQFLQPFWTYFLD